MLSVDGFGKAWNVLEWNLSFSIGDGVTLIMALTTILVAFFTLRIQIEQKKIVERQSALESQIIRREDALKRKKLLKVINNCLEVVLYDRDIKMVDFSELKKSEVSIKVYLGDNVYKLVSELIRYGDLFPFKSDSEEKKQVNKVKLASMKVVRDLLMMNKD